MQRQDVLSVLITFAVGFVGGGFLYFVHFGKLLNSTDTSTQAAVENLIIEGEAYGSCGDDCPSFQVKSDGSYRYQFAERKGMPKTIKSGELPSELKRAIKEAMIADDLEAQSESIQPTNCNSYNNGIDVRYGITLKGDDFMLDSCGTTVDGNSKAWTTLGAIWKYFETVQR